MADPKLKPDPTPLIDPPDVSPEHSLHFPVGPGQANDPRDVLNVQKGLNTAIRAGLLPSLELPEDGKYSVWLSLTIRDLSEKVAFGWADPHGLGGVTHGSGIGITHSQGVIEPNSALYRWMWQIGSEAGKNKKLEPGITREMYDLAALMVPSGVTTKKRLVDGTAIVVPGGIQLYIAPLLAALRAKELDDRDMLLMALATTRAETGRLAPIDEYVNRDGPLIKNGKPVLDKSGKPVQMTGTNTTKDGPAYDRYDPSTEKGDHKLGQRVGNTQPGDGARYHGRGLVQLTGRGQYAEIGGKIGVDLVNDPDKANDPVLAAKIMAQFLKNGESRIRSDLKRGDLGAARVVVNGGHNGLKEFEDAFTAGRKFLEDLDREDVIARLVSTWPSFGSGSLPACGGTQRPPGARGYRPAIDFGPRMLSPSTGPE